MAGGAHTEEGLALGLGLLVQQDLLGPVAPLPTDVRRVLGTRGVAGEIDEGSVGLRCRGVVLADPPLHFPEEGVLESLRRSQDRPGVGVLGFEVPANLGLQDGRVPQDLLPVLVLHPGVVVGPGAAELDDCLRLASGRGRPGRRVVSHAAGCPWLGPGGSGQREGGGARQPDSPVHVRPPAARKGYRSGAEPPRPIGLSLRTGPRWSRPHRPAWSRPRSRWCIRYGSACRPPWLRRRSASGACARACRPGPC